MSWFTDSKFAFCRGIANHAWRYPPTFEGGGRQLVMKLTCQNCAAVRTDRLNAGSGEVSGRSYHYAKGYLLPLDGNHRPPKDELRRDGLKLLLGSQTPVRKIRAA